VQKAEDAVPQTEAGSLQAFSSREPIWLCSSKSQVQPISTTVEASYTAPRKCARGSSS
jgi:hypothetical protein